MRSTREGNNNTGGVPQSNRVSRAILALRPRRKQLRGSNHNNDHETTSASNPPPSKPPLGRRVSKIVNTFSQVNAHGLGVLRPSDPLTSSAFSPFLLLEHCTPQRLPPSCYRSADFPRRGQQILTYLPQGFLTYSDSHGHNAQLNAGEAALLTANSGLVVSSRFMGPVVEYFSVWINTPRELRNKSPTFAHAHAFPVCIGEGFASARIRVLTAPHKHVSKTNQNTESELATLAGDAAVYDIRMQKYSQLVLNPETTRVFVYVYRGTAIIGKSTEVREGQMAILEEDKRLPLVIKSAGANVQDEQRLEDDNIDFDTFEENSCWCLVLAGNPIEEPVSMLPSGIVACTPQEMRKAFEEYTCGSMGSMSSNHSSPFAHLDDDDSDEESFDEMKKLFSGLSKKNSAESLPSELLEWLEK